MRKRHSDLLALLPKNGGGGASPRAAPVGQSGISAELRIPVAAPAKPAARTPVNPALLRRFDAEVKILGAMLQSYRATADEEGRKRFSFAKEKLDDAVEALNLGDFEKAWIHLFGAATCCKSFEISPQEADRVLRRLNTMLG